MRQTATALAATLALTFAGAQAQAATHPSTAATAYAPAATAASTPSTLASLAFAITGPGWTVPHRLPKLMDSAVGDTYNPSVFWRDVTRLRNNDIFLSVTATVVTDTAGTHATINIVDRWSLIPVVEPIFGADILRVVLGVQDGNFLGRNFNVGVIGGVLRTPNTQSFIAGAQFQDRQFLGQHFASAQILRDFGTQTFYDGRRAVSQFEARIVQAQIQSVVHVTDRFRPGAFVAVTDRRFDHVAGSESIPRPGFNPVSAPARSTDIQPGLTLTLGQVDFDRFQFQGWDLAAISFLQARLNGPPTYIGGNLQVRAFGRPHPRINLALRTRVSAQNSRHPTDAIAYGGFAHVRGYPSDFLRGTMAALINAELRAVLFPDLWRTFWVQGIAFIDAAALAQGSLAKPRTGDTMQSLGAGIRGTILPVWGTFVRIDVGVPIDPDFHGWDLSFSVRQFF